MRVLIVKVSSLGDIIHTLPAVTDAHRADANLTFDWVVEEGFTEVPSWHPAVDKVIPVAIRRWRRNLMKTYLNKEFRSFRRALQGIHYDLVIDAQGLIKSGLISRLSRGLTIGLSNRTIREPLATLFYNKVYSVPWTVHAVDRVRQLFSRALNYDYKKKELDYGINLDAISPNIGNGKRREIVFLHGTTRVSKYWPEEKWRHLASIATGHGYDVILPWGNEKEKKRAEFIGKDNLNVKVLDRQSLSDLARLISGSNGVVAVDTGLGHLAAALSTPTVSLYGPTDPGLIGTYGANQVHLGLEKEPNYVWGKFENLTNGL
ncbi:MAG: lipopolysaccharide heptosyltransferase I [Gammaproteobacteria bacterium]|nr:lipopolysaccharide heptosyltransferase I [Gammaproteobacteria bacterium]